MRNPSKIASGVNIACNIRSMMKIGKLKMKLHQWCKRKTDMTMSQLVNGKKHWKSKLIDGRQTGMYFCCWEMRISYRTTGF